MFLRQVTPTSVSSTGVAASNSGDQGALAARVAKIRTMRVRFVPSVVFKQASANYGEALALRIKILADLPMPIAYADNKSSDFSRSPFRISPSSVRQRALFRQMNFLKYLSRQIQEQIEQSMDGTMPEEPPHALASLVDEFDALMLKAEKIGNYLWQINLHLVFWVLNRLVLPEVFKPPPKMYLSPKIRTLLFSVRAQRHLIRKEEEAYIAYGYWTLGWLVKGFSSHRGPTFSSYAVAGLLKEFLKAARRDRHYLTFLRMESDETIDCADDEAFFDPYPLAQGLPEHPIDCRCNRLTVDEDREDIEMSLAAVVHGLSDRELAILVWRNGLLGHEVLTQNEIAAWLGGLTRERVRQIEVKVMKKLSRQYSGRLAEVSIRSSRLAAEKDLSLAKALEFDIVKARKESLTAQAEQKAKKSSGKERRTAAEIILQDNPLLLDSFDERERKILAGRLKLNGSPPKPIKKLAGEFNITPTYTRMILSACINKLLSSAQSPVELT